MPPHPYAPRVAVVVAIAALATACGDDDAASGPVDGGADGASAPDTGVTPPAEAMPPALPSLMPCPAGWRVVETAGDDPDPPTCEPWPAIGWIDCGEAAALLPGASECATIGAACPSGEWPEMLPVDAVYVRAEAAPGGDGSMGAPFATIAAALAAAPAGATIALSRGVHTGSITLPNGVTLAGACAAETRIVGAVGASSSSGIIMITAGESAVRDLTIDGPPIGVRADGPGTTLSLAGVVIIRSGDAAMAAYGGARIAGDELLVRDHAGALPGTFAAGGSELDLSRTLVLSVRNGGAAALGDSTVRMRDSAVRSTAAGTDPRSGFGIAIEGGRLEATSIVVEDSVRIGLHVSQGTATVEDAVIRDTTTPSYFGRGVSVRVGGTATLTRVLVERNLESGVIAFGPGAEATLVDAVVRETDAEPASRNYGAGLVAEMGGRLVVRRAFAARNREAGFLVAGGSSADAEDLTVIDTRGRLTDELLGSGALVQGASVATITRARLQRNLGSALSADGAGTHVTVTDAALSDTLVDPTGYRGRGLGAGGGATVVGERLLVERNGDVGIAASAATMTLSDLRVIGTRGAASGEYGHAVHGMLGAVVRVDRAILAQNRFLGVGAWDPGTDVVLADVVIDETSAAACGSTTCADAAGGSGIMALGYAHVAVTRFVVRRAALAGVQLVRDATMDLREGLISECAIGANVQVPGYDIARLSDRVTYVDNGLTIDGAALPVPDDRPPESIAR